VDRTQGRTRLGIEPLDRFREAAIPLRHDRSEQVLRSARVGFAESLDRPVEISEDSPDLLFQKAEAPSAEPFDLDARRQAERFGRKAICRFQIGANLGGRMRHETLVCAVRIHRPRGSVDERDRDQMKALALLVRDERHAERKEQQNLVLDSIQTRRDRGFRIEAGFAQRLGDPIRARDRALRHIPLTSAGDDRDQPLQEVAAGSDQFGLERPTSLRIERECEARRHLEIPLHRFGGLDPYEGFAIGDGRAKIRERLNDERP